MKESRINPMIKNDPAAYEPENGNNEDQVLELFGDDFVKLTSSRRNFLKVFGFSFASAAVLAACKRPVIKAIPYSIQPPELIPRKPLFFASTFYDGQEYCGILVKTIDGRPIKIEGNALVPFNGEGTTARVQASVLSLYDDARLKFPLIGGKESSWEAADEQIMKDLSALKDGGDVVLLTPTLISPTTISLINSFGSGFRNFRWIQYDAVSYSALREANESCFGESFFPDYHFGNADVVVGINCDFLGTWGAPVHFIPGYVSRRRPENGNGQMLYHIQYESGLSLTGSNADTRKKIKPSEEEALLSTLYNRIAEKTGAGAIPASDFREDLTGVAERLVAARGRSIVISGTNDKNIQIIVNGINSLLGNYGNCIDPANPLKLAAGNDRLVENLVDDMNSGRVKAVLMYNVNPVYDYHDPQKFLEGLGKASVTVNMCTAANETAGKAKYECPVNHFLESWDDAEITPGHISLQQPCISPIFNTRSFQDSLLKWSGNDLSWHDYLTAAWEKEYFPKSGTGQFRDFWVKSVSEGIFVSRNEGKHFEFRGEALLKSGSKPESQPSGDYEIILTESLALGNGMHANNPWLMELPGPVTRLCWDNVAAISPSDAMAKGIVTGQMIRIGNDIEIPAYIQPGQAEGTISIALGYGHENSGPVASNGINVYSFARLAGDNRKYGFNSGITALTGEKLLALTQLHNSQEGRPLARETTLTRFREDPESGNELHKEFESKHKSLYPDAPFDGFHWAMAIDLNLCIGCNTCVIACQAENNSPTVGRDEVRRNRIMQWIKVHRYYSDDNDNPKVSFQPVFCQHCDDAPCENVCPVSATNHSNEGLNQMAYNRCVGTKYCMNNCPYRVRRFNWFRYTNNKSFNYNTASDLGKMVLNPDVTVRERGVVEKCSFCVQRIQAKKLEAKLQNRVLNDLEIKPACMQACPAGAIVFGNLNDRNSEVSKLFSNPRMYHLLEELHTLPSVGFLTRVRNDEKNV